MITFYETPSLAPPRGDSPIFFDSWQDRYVLHALWEFEVNRLTVTLVVVKNHQNDMISLISRPWNSNIHDKMYSIGTPTSVYEDTTDRSLFNRKSLGQAIRSQKFLILVDIPIRPQFSFLVVPNVFTERPAYKITFSNLQINKKLKNY